jgi:hypothetical protein
MPMINHVFHRLKKVEGHLQKMNNVISGSAEFSQCESVPTALQWNSAQICVNPKLFDNEHCSDSDPYCNCPSCGKPTGTEPSLKQLRDSLRSDIPGSSAATVCEAIKTELGEEYLGCLWGEPWSALNCACPCEGGDKFPDYLKLITTKATFWDTPETTPLWRTAQMGLIESQMAIMMLDGDLSLRPGTIVNVVDVVPVADSGEGDASNKKFSGNWLVASINHIIPNAMNHNMILTLQRDSVPVSPDNVQEDKSFWEWLVG